MSAVVAPFDKNGELDLRATKSIVERLIETGVEASPRLGAQ